MLAARLMAFAVLSLAAIQASHASDVVLLGGTISGQFRITDGSTFRSGPGGGKFGKGAPKPPFRKEKRH